MCEEPLFRGFIYDGSCFPIALSHYLSEIVCPFHANRLYDCCLNRMSFGRISRNAWGAAAARVHKYRSHLRKNHRSRSRMRCMMIWAYLKGWYLSILVRDLIRVS